MDTANDYGFKVHNDSETARIQTKALIERVIELADDRPWSPRNNQARRAAIEYSHQQRAVTNTGPNYWNLKLIMKHDAVEWVKAEGAQVHALGTKCTSHRSRPSLDLVNPAKKTFGPRKSILLTPCANSRGSACVRALKYSEAAAEILTMAPISVGDTLRLRTSRMRVSTSHALTPWLFLTSIVAQSGSDGMLSTRSVEVGCTAGSRSRLGQPGLSWMHCTSLVTL